MIINAGIPAKLIWRTLFATVISLLWLAAPGRSQASGGSVVAWGDDPNGQPRGRTVGNKSGLRQLKSGFILSLVFVCVFWHPMVKAQFMPIPLSGGAVVKMTADYQRPYIYAVQAPASGATNGNLLFINTTNNSIDKTLVIGINPTDLTINYAEGRLYIASWGENATYVVDLTSQSSLPSLNLGTDIYKINAVKAGRIITEGKDQWVNVNIVDTTSGAVVDNNFFGFREGDGEADLTGAFYYHCDLDVSTTGGPHIHKFQISNDTLVEIADSQTGPYVTGTRNLILTHDGTKLFWNKNVYDTNLDELGGFGAEIYACSSNGEVAFSSTQVFDTTTWLPMYNLPVSSSVMNVDGSGRRLWYYNSATNGIESIATATMEVPSVIIQPTNQVVYSGNNAVVSVGAAGLEPLTYVWYLNGTNFATTTNGQVVVMNFQATNAGNYSVNVTNGYGFVLSSNAMLTVEYVAPVVVNQPGNLVQNIGTSATFAVNAAGSMPLSYQWQFNGTNIDGATNTILSLTNLQITNEGYYDAVVTNAFGSTNSSSAYLNVVDIAEALNTTNLIWTTGGDVPWLIETTVTHDGFAAAQSGVITAGQQSLLQTTVTGPGTLTFWWNVDSMFSYGYNFLIFSVNGAEQMRISFITGWLQQTVYIGSGTQVLQWAFTQPLDSAVAPAGWVDQVSFTPGSTPPFVTLNPTNQVVLLGSNATLNAAALGTPPLNYQWQLNLTNLDGATNASLALTNVQFADEGNYTLVVSNAFGVTNTTAVYLNVVDFTESLNATNLVWSSGGDLPWFPETSITHDGIAALQSGAITGSQQSTVQTTVSGPGTLSFWWMVSSETNNDYVNFSVDGLELFRISGTVNWQQITYSVAPGTHTLTWSYSKNATINNGADAAWLDQVNYVPGATSPVITANPANQTAQIGQAISFQVAALGTPPLNYQWQFNGTNNNTGATNALLTLAPWSSEGSYSVIVSNAYGVAVSSNATLTTPRSQIVPWGSNSNGQTNTPAGLGNVLAISAGGNDSMALKSDGTVKVWGNNSYGQTSVPAGLSNVVAISCGSFYDCLALKSDGTVIGWGLNGFGKATAPAGLSNVVAIAAGDNHSLILQNNGQVVAWGSNSSGQTNVPAGLTNAAAIAAGSAHNLALRSDGTVIAWGSNSSGQTNVPLSLTNAVAIAACGNDSVALRSDGTVAVWGDNSCGQTNVPASLTNAVAIAAGSSHNLALRSDGTVVAWGNNSSGQTNVPVGLGKVVALAAGQSHSLALVSDGPLVVATQPLNQTTYAGMTAVFTANVLGLRPLVYQWQFNGTNIDGATNALLTLINVQPTNTGSYNLVISNAFGTITSSNASLTVVAVPPMLVLQPTNQLALPGSNATFTVAAGTGPIPIFYQWQFNGTNIAGATNDSLTLTNVQFTNQGIYQVVVSNAFGTTISSNATLTVVDLATALNAPDLVWTNGGSAAWFAETSVTYDGVAAAQSGAIANSQTSTLQTSVAGPGTLTFWWSFSQQNSPFDSLGFYVNGSRQASSSSTFNWQQKAFYLGSGAQTLQWTYSRSFIPFGNMSTGWVDQVTFTPGGTPLIITLVPTNQFLMTRATANFVSSATGTPPIGYQWQFNGTNLARATNSSLTIASVQPTNSGTYTLTITNPYGSFVTNVTLFVQPFALNTASTNPWLTTSGLLMQVDGVLTPNALVIYASTNLTTWLPILTNPPATGSVRVLDSSATNLPFRFYRAGEQ